MLYNYFLTVYYFIFILSSKTFFNKTLFITSLEGTYSFVDFKNQGVLENCLLFANINDAEVGFAWDVDKFIFMLGEY
jgi:hypothetical protein